MAIAAHLVALAGFAALMAAAAVEDFRRLVIPNRLVAGLCILWPLHLGTAPDATMAAAVAAVGGAAAVLFAGTLLFARGMIGGGDVKLFSAAALWAGAAALPPLFALTGLIGGLLALFFLTPLGVRITASRRLVCGAANVSAIAADPLPYGVAIAAAALIVTLAPHLG